MHHPLHGVWTARPASAAAGPVAPPHQSRLTPIDPDLRRRLDTAGTALPAGAAFSHATAALIHGLPVPAHLEHRLDLDICAPTSSGQPRREGWAGHRGAERRQVVTVHGLPVTDIADTWVDLGALATRRWRLLDLDDLVVAGDEVLNRLMGRHTRRSNAPGQAWHHNPRLVAAAGADLEHVLGGRVRPRGKALLIQARTLMRPGVRSPQETRARLLFVRAGLPEPQVNANLYAVGGGWLGEGDLVWPGRRVVAEYQGDHHAQRSRRSADAQRLAVLRDEGWTVHEIWAEDLLPGARRSHLLIRVADALGLDPGTVHLW